MFLAKRGLREDEELRVHRLAGEYISVVQTQARKVWVESLAAGVGFTVAAVMFAIFQR